MHFDVLWHHADLRVAWVVFIAYLLVDALYAYYTLAVVQKQPFRAASVGSLMHFLIAFGVLNYVQNILYLVPLALGSFFGTYVVLWYEQKKE